MFDIPSHCRLKREAIAEIEGLETLKKLTMKCLLVSLDDFACDILPKVLPFLISFTVVDSTVEVCLVATPPMRTSTYCGHCFYGLMDSAKGVLIRLNSGFSLQ